MANLKAPENCVDCHHHKVIGDRDMQDWYCDDDVAIVCTAAPNPKQDLRSSHQSDHSPHRVVMCAIRPHHLRTEGTSPAWCPIKRQAEAQAMSD